MTCKGTVTLLCPQLSLRDDSSATSSHVSLISARAIYKSENEGQTPHDHQAHRNAQLSV